MLRLRRLPPLPREPHWSTAIAVGGKEWLSGLSGNDEMDPHFVVAQLVIDRYIEQAFTKGEDHASK